MAAAALITGAASGIGLALVEALREHPGIARIFAATRSPDSASRLAGLSCDDSRIEILGMNLTEPASLSAAAGLIAHRVPGTGLDLVINTAGILHEGIHRPEKRLADTDAGWLQRSFAVNATGVLLLARALEPVLRASSGAWFASLSARVGSIGDNRLGGWYAYRASKAAQNMMIRTLAIEWSRLRPPIGCVALHPGTVDTGLSQPFLVGNLRHEVFSAERAAAQLLNVIGNLRAEQSGAFLAWDGSAIGW